MQTNQNSYVLIDLSPACKNNVFDVYINGEPLEFNREAKYLGAIIDNKLTWR